VGKRIAVPRDREASLTEVQNQEAKGGKTAGLKMCGRRWRGKGEKNENLLFFLNGDGRSEERQGQPRKSHDKDCAPI